MEVEREIGRRDSGVDRERNVKNERESTSPSHPGFYHPLTQLPLSMPVTHSSSFSTEFL